MNPMSARWARLYKGTPAEIAIEPAIAALGLVYRTQFPGYLYGFRFFPDVFLPQLNLIIEIDDSSHSKSEKKEADAERTAYLNSRGWRVARCTNDEALSNPERAVRACLERAGITQRDIDVARKRPLKDCLPTPGKASRAARSKARIAARSKPPTRPTPPRSPDEDTSSPTPSPSDA